MTLEQVRNKEGLTPMGAAGKAGVSLATWEGYESGNAKLGHALTKILKAFNLTAKIRPDGSIDYQTVRQ